MTATRVQRFQTVRVSLFYHRSEWICNPIVFSWLLRALAQYVDVVLDQSDNHFAQDRERLDEILFEGRIHLLARNGFWLPRVI